MIEIAAAVCMISSAQHCRDIVLSFEADDVTPVSCMMQGQIELAKWTEGHPNWRISAFHLQTCRKVRESLKSDLMPFIANCEHLMEPRGNGRRFDISLTWQWVTGWPAVSKTPFRTFSRRFGIWKTSFAEQRRTASFCGVMKRGDT